MRTRLLVLAAVFVSAVVMMNSCNDDRFDFSEFESVNAEGQWNVPIGTKTLSFEMFLNQLAENDYVSFDSEGNLQLSYSFLMDTVVRGADFMSFENVQSVATAVLDNPHPYALDAPMNDTLHVEQQIDLASDFISLKSATIRTGIFSISVETDVERIDKIIVRSPNMFESDGSPASRVLVLGENDIDVSGLRIVNPDGNVLNVVYDICYQAYEYTGPSFAFDGVIDVRDLKIQELRGSLNDFSTHFRVDTTFDMPIDQIEGDITFTEASLTLNNRNSFSMSARLSLDTAMFYGDQIAPMNIFSDYPVVADIHYAPHYVPMFSQSFPLNINTDFNSVLISGDLFLNPDGVEVVICDTATMGVSVEALLPIIFNIPDVTYEDTLDLQISEINAPELITEVLLHVDFDSELPFNFTAQMLTLEEGVATDSLFANQPNIRGSFDGTHAITQTEVSITNERLNHLINADGLLLRLGVSTENYNVTLNLEDMLSVTLRADIQYDSDLSN